MTGSAPTTTRPTTRSPTRRNAYFFDDFRLRGTFAPALRASDSPIAIACFRLFTFLPERPLLSVPSLRSCIARLTLLDAFFPYFLGMGASACKPLAIGGCARRVRTYRGEHGLAARHPARAGRGAPRQTRAATGGRPRHAGAEPSPRAADRARRRG